MGGEMREIVDAGQVGRLFAALALLLPPICLLCGWLYGRRRDRVRQGAIWGLAAGLLGPLNWALWSIYNRITDSLGLDTVRNLVVNAVMFIVVGGVIGIGAGLALRRADAERTAPPPTDEPE